MGICSFKDMRECNGHSEAAPGSECFLRGLPETEGNNDFLSSLSTSHTSQGPEPASSHVLIWMWALKILVQTQTRDLGLLVPFEKKGTVSPNPHTFRNGLFTLYLVGLGVPGPACERQTPPIQRQPRRIKCASAYAETNSETQNPPRDQFLFFQCFPTRAKWHHVQNLPFFFVLFLGISKLLCM